ncbi:MAG: TAXI family TRAP transporter solute-binding subunit [Desulfosalsimonas sp.]
MKKRNFMKILSIALAVILAGFIAGTSTAEARRVSVQINTADPGSYGYSIGSYMQSVLNRELPKEYTVTVHPYAGTSAGMRALMEKGDGMISYTADVGMTQVYERSGPYEKLSEDADLMVHTLYAYPMETFYAVHAKHAENYNSWADLSGEDYFFTPSGYMNWLNTIRMFEALGYEHNHVEVDNKTLADSLRSGSIVGAACYTTAGQSLASWWEEAQMKVDIEIVNPTDEEIAALEEAGLSPVKVDPQAAFSNQPHIKEDIIGVPILFGFNTVADTDEELIYLILKAFYENRDKLAQMDPGFGPMADDFVGMQVKGISANPEIPVHKGLKKFLEEHDAWDDSWVVAD